MPLPVTIASVAFPVQNYHVGPFKVGTSFYIVLLDSTDASLIEMHKADGDDPTDAWSEVGGAGRPDIGAADVITLWAVVDGTTIHVAAMLTAAAGATGSLAYYSFATATDAWTTSGGPEGEVISIPDTSLNESCSIGIRADGDIIILFAGDQDNIMGTRRDRIDYARWEGSVWTVVQVDNDAAGAPWDAEDYDGSILVKGSSDRMHFFLRIRTSNHIFQRTLTSANSLQSWPSAFDTAIATDAHPFGPGVSFDDGGTQRVRVPFRDSNNQVSLAEFDSGDTPTPTVNPDVSDNDALTGNGFLLASVANDGTDVWLVYVGGGVDGVDADLYSDLNDGTDTLELASVFTALSAGIYDRSGTKIALVYSDTGTIKYDEIDIGVAPATVYPPWPRHQLPLVRM